MITVSVDTDRTPEPDDEGVPIETTRFITLTQDSVHDYFQRIAEFRVLEHSEVITLCRSIEAGLLAWDAARDRSRSDRELVQLQRAGEDAFDTMVRHNLRLVVSVARTASVSATSMPDVIQAGNTGLLMAVQRFDWQRGYRFSTYATWWIRKMINQEYAMSRTIRLPPAPLARVNEMNRMERSLGESLQRDPSPAEIAAAVEIPLAEVLHLRRIGQQLLSLDQPIGTATESTIFDVLADDSDDLGDQLHEESLLTQLRRQLEALPAKSARILTIRYGLDGNRPRTLRSVALLLGIPTSEVESLERQALTQLRSHLESLVQQ